MPDPTSLGDKSHASKRPTTAVIGKSAFSQVNRVRLASNSILQQNAMVRQSTRGFMFAKNTYKSNYARNTSTKQFKKAMDATSFDRLDSHNSPFKSNHNQAGAFSSVGKFSGQPCESQLPKMLNKVEQVDEATQITVAKEDRAMSPILMDAYQPTPRQIATVDACSQTSEGQTLPPRHSTVSVQTEKEKDPTLLEKL